MMAQMKRKKIVSMQCLVKPEAKPKIKNRYECKGKQLRCKIYYANCRIKRKKIRTLNNESRSDNNCCDHSLHICKKCVQWPHQKYLNIGLFLLDCLHYLKTITHFHSINHKHLEKGRYLRSSCPDVFCKKGVLKNFANFAGKHLCQSLYFNKFAGLTHSCFPVNFAKFLRIPFLTEHLRWLLMILIHSYQQTILEILHKFGHHWASIASCKWQLIV